MAQENGFKETKIGLIPNDWKVIKLGDCIDTKKGRKPETLTNSFEDGFEPYLTADYFRTGNTKYFVDVEKEKNSIIVDKEDIVLIWDGSNAGDVFTGLRGILASTMVKIIPKNNLTRQHLFYFLKTKFDILNEKTTGSTIPHVSKSIFEGLPFVLPPLIEQQEITFVLSKIQQTIAQQEKIVTKTKELKRSLMHRLFTYGLRGEELKETEIGLMPESWELTSIGEVYEFTTKPRGIDLSKYKELPFIPMELISENQRLLHKYEMRKSFSSGTYVQKGDLVVAKITPSFENGKQGIVTKIPLDFCYATTEVWPLHGINDLSDINYLYYFLKKPDVRNEIAGKMEGSTGRQRVPKSVIAETKIPLPSYEEQLEINDIFVSLDQKIEMKGSKMKNLQVLFKSMLQLLMTGQVRVKDLDFGEDCG